nr:ATP synthase F0 subunit 8 [Phestilla sp. CUS-2023]
MPQLSPMLGIAMFVIIMALIFGFMMAISKKYPKINSSKVETLEKPSFIIFKLWNGSKMPKL